MENLINQIKSHDWEYNNSDDLRVFEKGLASEASIMRQLSGVKLEDLTPHFDEYINKKLKVLHVRTNY
jgi:hypothetical protein